MELRGWFSVFPIFVVCRNFCAALEAELPEDLDADSSVHSRQKRSIFPFLLGESTLDIQCQANAITVCAPNGPRGCPQGYINIRTNVGACGFSTLQRYLTTGEISGTCCAFDPNSLPPTTAAPTVANPIVLPQIVAYPVYAQYPYAVQNAQYNANYASYKPSYVPPSYTPPPPPSYDSYYQTTTSAPYAPYASPSPSYANAQSSYSPSSAYQQSSYSDTYNQLMGMVSSYSPAPAPLSYDTYKATPSYSFLTPSYNTYKAPSYTPPASAYPPPAPSYDTYQAPAYSPPALYSSPAPSYDAYKAPAYTPTAPSYPSTPPPYSAAAPSYNSYQAPTYTPASPPAYQPPPAPQYPTPSPPYTAPVPEYPRLAPPQYLAPTPQYAAPGPQYSAPTPQYSKPAPQYAAPGPQYPPSSPTYDVPQPVVSPYMPVISNYAAPAYDATKNYDKSSYKVAPVADYSTKESYDDDHEHYTGGAYSSRSLKTPDFFDRESGLTFGSLADMVQFKKEDAAARKLQMRSLSNSPSKTPLARNLDVGTV
ncbi:hypothetical protein RvY_03742 [Ramazzottius varieornatus]|uniref:Uncharacterized protein n=1 Tax=Ramazzottius varieornatus TaxID=947166 RepID=A0A1D1UYI6_RAMVA|nr:hypothetical protein RvY_03742 [Ramazzottius varieornatus]